MINFHVGNDNTQTSSSYVSLVLYLSPIAPWAVTATETNLTTTSVPIGICLFQCCYSFGLWCHQYHMGFIYGLQSVMILNLRQPGSRIQLTAEQESWIRKFSNFEPNKIDV